MCADKTAVSYAESLEITGHKVGVFIQNKPPIPDLLLTGCTGLQPFGPRETTQYGFVTNRRVIRNRSNHLWKFLAISKEIVFEEGDLVALLWLSNESRKASHKHWVLEVQGREYVAAFTKLANELSDEFKVEIHIRLESEQPELVLYTSCD